MAIYDFQRATADRIADIFRQATIDTNGNEIKSEGQRRVLLADEVGLGKTHVASAVIDRVREMRKAVNDDMFRVVYVCSNMSIANQNIEKLGIKNKADVTESRLSMQHLTIREREAKIVNSKSGKMGEIIIPLTPSTSFSLRGNSKGNAAERALIVTILERFDEFSNFQHHLSRLFQANSGDSGWGYWLKRYSKRVSDLGQSYIKDVHQYLYSNQTFLDIQEELIGNLKNGDLSNLDSTRIINMLRRIFADLSLSMLEPDLIIMDEFQRFSSLLDYNDESEQSVIAKKFFEQEGGQQPLILLLSATPYKPFSTLEELTEYNADEHYEDFNRLMNFLFSGENEFHELWSDYSHKLSHIRTEQFDVILASKQLAEKKMYDGMCRTERLNEGLISTEAVVEIPISTDDILSFCEMQRIISACKEASGRSSKLRFSWSNVPMEYVKSSPYLLSFMDTYELKQKIYTVYQGRFKGLPEPSEQVLLREKDISQFHKIPMRNARMQYLRDIMLPKGRGTEFLLWVPASRPYYTTNAENPFVKNHDFSKVLVFSAWEMVPRMIATLMTYEAEREVLKNGEYRSDNGSNRLRGDSVKLLTTPWKCLTEMTSKEEWKSKTLSEIRKDIENKIIHSFPALPFSKRIKYSTIYETLCWLEDNRFPKPTELSKNTVQILTEMAISSPAICLYRVTKNFTESRKTAELFVSLFNKRIAGKIIDRLPKSLNRGDNYLQSVLNYCSLGNLQAVIDEFLHLKFPNAIGPNSYNSLYSHLEECFLSDSDLTVETDQSFPLGRNNKYRMRTGYAVPFGKKQNLFEDNSIKHSNNIRTAFQSPFYPFIIASTSVGQEGLDFHWYCRKIVHWNLPSNPQDLEQREGRINRYKCLAIRRNIAMIFPDIYDWDKLFDTANEVVRKQFGKRYSEMVPNWCLPTEWLHDSNIDIEWIERIVPQYPMSSDIDKYHRLIDMLSLYRLTMGQPRQEELLEMLETLRLDDKQIRQLLFDLSPISRHK